MKTLLLLLCLGGLAFAASSPTASVPMHTVSAHGGSQVVMIEGVGEPGQGWVEIAPIGNTATEPGAGKGLVKIPFSVLGNTKVLINMEHAAWVYSVGQETTVHDFRDAVVTDSGEGGRQASPLLITGLEVGKYLEVTFSNGDTKTLEGDHQYIFPQKDIGWMQLPKGANAHLLRN